MSDRPLGRSLIRLGAMALGRSRAHRQDLWPSMAIGRDSGAIYRRGKQIATLLPFDAVVPQRLPMIAVVGSGPSLSQQHPERLPPGSAILCNGAASLTAQVAPMAVAVEDERFIFRHAAMLAGLPDALPFFLSPAALRALADFDAGLLADRPLCLIHNLAKPVNRARRPLSDPTLDRVLWRDGDAALSRDPDTGVVITGTVAFSATQIALAAAPDEVLLAGIDLGNAAEPRFYETAGNRAPSGLERGMDRILAGFALAREVAAKRGITLSCASPVSALLGLGIPRDTRLDG